MATCSTGISSCTGVNGIPVSTLVPWHHESIRFTAPATEAFRDKFLPGFPRKQSGLLRGALRMENVVSDQRRIGGPRQLQQDRLGAGGAKDVVGYHGAGGGFKSEPPRRLKQVVLRKDDVRPLGPERPA